MQQALRELARRASGSTLYNLDEPITGLHCDGVTKARSSCNSHASSASPTPGRAERGLAPHPG